MTGSVARAGKFCRIRGGAYLCRVSGIFAGMTTALSHSSPHPSPQAAHPLAVQDMVRILGYLQNCPATTAEVARALRLTVARTNGLLLDLREQGLAQVDRCTTNSKGMSVNVWACRMSVEPVE